CLSAATQPHASLSDEMTVKCARSSLLVAVVAVGMATVLAAPSVDSSSTSTKTESGVQRRPHLWGSVDWYSIRDHTICPAQVAFNRQLQVLEVWCADGVEGLTFEARGRQYVCASLRYTIPVNDLEVDVLGGCVARLARPEDVSADAAYAEDI
uniref:hypothetical protein n=1 Tax=Escherichia coli TaxID=562 RepID=UPI002254E0DA